MIKIVVKINEVPTLRENCPYSEFFWSIFSCIRIEYEKYGIVYKHFQAVQVSWM